MNRGFFFMKFTSMRKLVLFVITTVLATFFLISMMVTSMKETKSTYLYNWLNELSMNGYMYVLGKENHYFTQEYRNLNQDFSISSFLFSMATNIRFNDVRSLSGKSFPGLVSTIQKLLLRVRGQTILTYR